MVIEKDIIQRSAGYRKHIYESSPSWNPWHRVRWIFERILVQASCRMFENYPNTFKTHSRKILSFHACTVLDVLSFLRRIFVLIFLTWIFELQFCVGGWRKSPVNLPGCSFFLTIPHFFQRSSKFIVYNPVMYIKCLHGDLASSPNVSLHGDVGGSVEGSLCKDPTIPTKIESFLVPGSCYFFKRCLQRGSDESFVRISWDFPTMLLPYVRGPLPE